MPISETYNVNCMEYMKSLPDKAFDLAVVDPPYFSGPEKRRYYGNKVSKIGVHRDYPVSPEWHIPDHAYFEELRRVSKHFIIWGCNYFKEIFPPGRIVRDKCNSSSSFSDCELAATNIHDSVRLFQYMWNGMIQGKSSLQGSTMQGNKSLNEKRIHPTQKPIALYNWTFARYAKPGDKILDTHLGSQSSRIAAYDAGLDFVGCEIDPYYFQAGNERFEAHAAQQNLFLEEEKV